MAEESFQSRKDVTEARRSALSVVILVLRCKATLNQIYAWSAHHKLRVSETTAIGAVVMLK